MLQNYSPGKEKLKHLLFLIAILGIGFSLTAPRWGYKDEERCTKGIDLLVAVDVSKSMLAEDIKPNRLERTKLAVLDLVQKFSGHRVGLIAFAGTSFLQCPLTLDYNAFTQSLNTLDTDLIPVAGTAINSALELGEKIYDQTQNQKLLLLFSDGEELAESAISGAKRAKESGISVYTVGIGSLEGSTIPLISPKTGRAELLKDRNGQVVKTALDEATLREVAQITDGQYYHLSPRALEKLKKDILEKFPLLKEKVAGNFYVEKVPQEQYQLFLFLGFLLLLLEMLVNTAKKQKPYSLSIYYKLSLLAISGCLFWPQLSAKESQGEILYNKGEFEKALDFYNKALVKKPQNNDLLFNSGTTLLSLNRCDEAVESFEKALPNAPFELQKKIFYNRGNAFFQKGIASANPQDKLASWEKSKNDFQSAIDLDVSFANAKQNLKYVEEEIRKLKDQKNKQNPDQNKDENKNQNQDNPQKNPENPEDNKDKNSQQDKQNEQNNPSENSKNNENNNDQKDQNNASKSHENKEQNENDPNLDPDKNDSEQSPENQDENKKEKENQSKDEQKDPEKNQQNQSPSPENSENDRDENSENDPSPKNETPWNQPAESPTDNAQDPEEQPSQGKMTAAEARQLLNSLENDEKKLPFKVLPANIRTRNLEKFW